MVIPLLRRSLTRSTLLMTSRPRLSNTRTFHTGSPSSFSKASIWYCPVLGSLLAPSATGASWLRLSIRSMDAIVISHELQQALALPTYLTVAQRLRSGSHVEITQLLFTSRQRSGKLQQNRPFAPLFEMCCLLVVATFRLKSVLSK